MSKGRQRLLVALCALALLCFVGFTQATSRQTFEYKFEYGPSEKKANELGVQGWQLVAIQSTGPGVGNNTPTYVFVRSK